MSNIKFSFDPSRPAGARVVAAEIGGKPIEPDRQYVVVTRGYMARGKDGYASLLVTSEGGQCEEVVSEENGILMSLMLRQYFMSLRVIGQWANWCPSMKRHWGRVSAEVGSSHPHLEPGPGASSPATEKAGDGSGKRERSWADFTPSKLRTRRASLAPADQATDGSNSDGDDDGDGHGDGDDVQAIEVDDRELNIMRRAFRKWCRLAGVQSRSCDNLPGHEVEGLWTRAVVAKVEGRITIVPAEGRT